MFFLLLFLSGWWVQPLQISGPLQTIMFYWPTGAAAKALLYSVYNTTPPVGALVAMACYMAVIAFVAVRFFRWE